MSEALTTNRKMYWRIVRRMLLGNRPRLLVILLALGAGAAVTSALLNLRIDAKRRITSEFKTFGPNVVVSPKTASFGNSSATLDEAVRRSIPSNTSSSRVVVSSFLYVLLTATSSKGATPLPVVAVGHRPFTFAIARNFGEPVSLPAAPCRVGKSVAERLAVSSGSELTLRSNGPSETCQVTNVMATGGSEDNQIWIELPMAQNLAGMPGRVSAIELIVSGTPKEIQSYVSALQRSLPDLDVRPVRQFTEAQAKIYGRISGLLNLTVGIVLVLTGLCVMAAMANVAIERRNDVGLMKAIGGATRRVLRLFLVEAAVLGLVGGIAGGALGIALSIYLGKAVFGLAARPRWVVYPVSVMLTLIVAILAAFPLRRLAGIRPASVFRGEA